MTLAPITRRLRPTLAPVVSLLALTLSSCGTPASAFDPSQLGAVEGGLFGHFQMLKAGRDITSSCYVEVVDERKQRLRYISLDKSGWLFTSVRPGPAKVSFVLCPRIDGNEGMRLIDMLPEHAITVVSGGIVYFGHLKLDFPENRAYDEPGPAEELEITHRLAEAGHEFHARYPASRLEPSLSPMPLVNPLEGPKSLR